MKSFWYPLGWSIILYGSFLVLACLFLYNWIRKGYLWETGSSHVTIQNILSSLFHRQSSPSSNSSSSSSSTSVNQSPVDTYKRVSSNFSSSKGEEQCRRFLEYLFQKPFQRIRPPFLTNPITHQCLELDCYNEDLKLAIEYNGSQHYHFNSMMHQNSKHSFQNQQYRDYIKKDLCERHGITLIVVPYTIPIDQIPHYLYDELKQRNCLPVSSKES